MSATDIYTIEELKILISEKLLKENKKTNKFRFIKYNKELLNLVEKHTDFLNINVKLQERIYCIMNEISEIPKCSECGKEVKFVQYSVGYSKTCCNICAQNSELVKEIVIKTNIEKYGVSCSLLNEEVKNKTIITNMEKFGVTHQMKCDEVKDKIKITNNERYGCDNPMQNEDIQEKTRNTNIERYGCDNPMQNEDIQEKTRNTNIAEVSRRKNARKNVQSWQGHCDHRSHRAFNIAVIGLGRPVHIGHISADNQERFQPDRCRGRYAAFTFDGRHCGFYPPRCYAG